MHASTHCLAGLWQAINQIILLIRYANQSIPCASIQITAGIVKSTLQWIHRVDFPIFPLEPNLDVPISWYLRGNKQTRLRSFFLHPKVLWQRRSHRALWTETFPLRKKGGWVSTSHYHPYWWRGVKSSNCYGSWPLNMDWYSHWEVVNCSHFPNAFFE